MNKLVFEERIYTYHIDIVGHVNNIVYITWMENGRMRLLEAMGIPVVDLMNNQGIVAIINNTSITYKKPFFIYNSVKIELWISKLNNASVILEFRFFNENDELCATGQQKGLFINTISMCPARLNEKHRKAFEQFLIRDC